MALLERIHCPGDLRALPESALPDLASEIRARLIDSVTQTGGHLGPNLGVVELTIALHRVFDSPHDALVWDTGHQAYVHKMLTGRWAALDSLRQEGGLSGYPSRSESAHDIVENSHASTALSYADGLAKAFAIGGRPDRAVVAVVGDGSLTGGMAWEALNNIAAAPERPIVVVLNDNGRSYAPTAGAVGRHLAALRDGPAASVFEQLGLAYLGPVDGHDAAAVEVALRKARSLGTPVVVHCLTRKGLGHAPAEQDEADRMHTVGPAGPSSGKRSWTSVFGAEMVALGAARPDVVAISAAMLGPTGLQAFADAYPSRAFDVGIAEQHAVTSAAGLATGGLHPVVCVYSTFLNRALDQVLMDVALHRLPVTFVLDRAGVTGSDGPSHHGMWDLSLLGMVPGMRVAAPRDGDQLKLLLREAVDHHGPAALRFPKADVGPALAAVGQLGTADVLRWGPGLGGQRGATAPGGVWRGQSAGEVPASGVAPAAGSAPEGVLVLAIGPLGAAALAAAERLAVPVTVADPRWLLPVDPELVAAAAAYRLVVTVEDNGAHGGYGDAVSRALRKAGSGVPVRSLALPQRFLAHGSRSAILKARGLDSESIAAAVRRELPLA
ncbi:1-deoxy-D-xylulose-5-phosphate synthase [Asanoa iriomotensis]|uniref:1-deoxy-D-xylulose-5-phosphate synthase n=1 Tax=Asanoa iriomotensis TaxID=234613 RepID=A0ABQ4C8W8_9ACTN|nr:1-deoxy-D-xylulose-5-phosphate synthase [Asanoa iriomotensis]GIF59228.1 1-deoxy-D-xylulose-5-phosphate synthase [Asanoa iriomotensis]